MVNAKRGGRSPEQFSIHAAARELPQLTVQLLHHPADGRRAELVPAQLPVTAFTLRVEPLAGTHPPAPSPGPSAEP